MSIWVVFLLLLALWLVPLAWPGGRAYLRYRGRRAVHCPETGLPAIVRADVAGAAASAVIGDVDLRVSSCSRWPEREDCSQRCLSQIEAAPPECVLRSVLLDWDRRADCGVCGREIGEIHWVEYEPALLTPQRKTVEWERATPQNLTEVLQTHRRVCWGCHVGNAWRDRFPGFRADQPTTQPP